MPYKAGDTFHYQHPWYSSTMHLCVVLCDEYGDPPCVIIAPVNTRVEQSEITVLLSAGSHTCIDRESVVTFMHMTSVRTSEIDAAPHNIRPPLNPPILKRIIEGAIISDEAPKKYQEFLKKISNL